MKQMKKLLTQNTHTQSQLIHSIRIDCPLTSSTASLTAVRLRYPRCEFRTPVIHPGTGGSWGWSARLFLVVAKPTCPFLLSYGSYHSLRACCLKDSFDRMHITYKMKIICQLKKRKR